MATDAKELIVGWCSVADDLQLSGERSEPGSEWALALTSGGAEILASQPSGRDRVVLSQPVEVADSAAIARHLAALEARRPAPVTLTAGSQGVVVSTWIVLDGLTKHSLLSAVGELARTREAVLQLARTPVAETAERTATGTEAQETAAAGAAATSDGSDQRDAEVAAASATSTQPSPWAPAAEAAAAGAAERPSTGPAPWTGVGSGSSYQSPGYQQPAYQQQGYAQQGASGGYGQGQAGAAQGYGQAYGSQASGSPAPTVPGWNPGHKVPPQGMQAWAAPDPNGAVVATLGGHLPVQVAEMRGAWARVICSNGWQGWVDGRLLVAGP
jgi:hypothetical protein